ncbi:MAG: hypothetical protein ACRDTP_12260 [Mycobacteriales bacterium]
MPAGTPPVEPVTMSTMQATTAQIGTTWARRSPTTKSSWPTTMPTMNRTVTMPSTG